MAFQTLGRKRAYTEEPMFEAVGGGAENSAPGAELPEDGEPMAPEGGEEYEEEQPWASSSEPCAPPASLRCARPSPRARL